MKRHALAIVLLAGLAAAGCGNEGPVAGELEVRLASPNSDDRAVLFRLIGEQTALSAPSGSGYRVFHGAPAGDTVRVVVMAPQGGHLAAGPLVRVAVPDTRAAAAYRAVVQQVASTAYVPRPTTVYALTVVQP